MSSQSCSLPTSSLDHSEQYRYGSSLGVDSDPDNPIFVHSEQPKADQVPDDEVGPAVHTRPTMNFPQPHVYHIGESFITTPLVDMPQVKAHLALLHKIKDLRSRLEHAPNDTLCDAVRGYPAESKWGFLVSLAVERFQLWVNANAENASNSALQSMVFMPPVDVLMVWHAYMLNPTWFAEDCQRISIMKTFTHSNVYHNILAVLLQVQDFGSHKPSETDFRHWVSLTNTPYDIFDAMHTMSKHSLTCPSCRAQFDAPFTEYFGPQFSLQCPHCEYTVTKDSLAVAKLVQDLITKLSGRTDTVIYPLAGTLRTVHNPCDDAGAERIVHAIKQHCELASILSIQDEATVFKQMIHSYGKMSTLRPLLMQGVDSKDYNRLERMLSAYTDDRPFSLDLAGAVNRQYKFAEKMYSSGWTSASLFDNPANESVFTDALARYHGFLDLMTLQSDDMLVPTLDIDLVWHTHQLTGQAYQDDCMNLVGRYIDHDDNVGETVLSNSFELMCQLWQAEFGVPYTHSGHPSPSPKPSIMGRSAFKRSPSSPAILSSRPAQSSSRGAKNEPSALSGLKDLFSAITERRERRRLRRSDKARRKKYERWERYGDAIGQSLEAGAELFGGTSGGHHGHGHGGCGGGGSSGGHGHGGSGCGGGGGGGCGGGGGS